MRAATISGLMLFLLSAVSLSAWSSDGSILNFEGDVRVNGEPVTDETSLKSSDTVTTGESSSVRIILSDNSVLDLDADSEILISDYSFNPSEPDTNNSEVDILSGTLRYVSGRIAKDDPDNVSFTAGNSTIGVRGTYISISVSPSESE